MIRLVAINLAASGKGGGGGWLARWLAYYIIIAIIVWRASVSDAVRVFSIANLSLMRGI